jgi:hypothetical protein
LWKVLRVQRDDEVGISVLSTITNVIVVRVRRQLVGRAELDMFALSAQRVDDFSDERAADTKPGEHLSVLVQNFSGDQPDERPVFYPALYKFRTGNVALVDRALHSSDAGN